MGQAESGALPEAALSQSTQSHLERRFIVSPHPVYVNNPEFKLLHEKLTNKQYILRIMTVSDDFERAKLQENIFRKIASKNEYLPKLEHYIFEEHKGYCGKLVKCFLFFEIGEFSTFREEILKQANHRAPFTEDQLLKGIDNLMYGLLWLRFFKEPHGNINTLNIFYRNGALLLSDPLIAPASNENPERFISPQKMQKIQNIIDEYDPYVSDVFAIAMCILEAIKYGHMQKIYKKNGKLNTGLLIEEVNKLKFERLKELLQRLLVSASNTEHRKVFLQNFWRKYSQSMVSSHISSERMQKIHTIGGGRKANTQKTKVQSNFMTTQDVNLQFRKDKSVGRIQKVQPTIKHLDSSQLIYRINPEPSKFIPSYHPEPTTTYNSYQYSRSNPPMHQNLNYNKVPASFHSSSNTFSSINNRQPLGTMRNNSVQKLVPSLDTLGSIPRFQLPRSYLPVSHELKYGNYLYKGVAQKLEYPPEAKPVLVNNNWSSTQPASSIIQKKDTSGSNYKNRFMGGTTTPQKTEQRVEEHSFPKRISSLKKYSENSKYQKYLEGHDSVKKTFSKKGSNNSDHYQSEVLGDNEGEDISSQKAHLTDKKAEVSNRKENGTRSDQKKISERKNYDNIVIQPCSEEIPLNTSNRSVQNQLKQDDISKSNQSISTKQKSEENKSANGQEEAQRELKGAVTPVVQKVEQKEPQNSNSTSKEFSNILEQNLEHLEAGISKAIEKTINNLNGQPVSSFDRSNSDFNASNNKHQSSQSSNKLENLPLMTSEVVPGSRIESEGASETMDEQSRQIISESYEINIPDAKDEHLNVKNSLNVQEEQSKSDKEPRSPKTPSRPYNHSTHNRYNRTIPEEDPADQESIEEGLSPPKSQAGEYREQEYENGGRYCGFVVNNQRNGEGTFYYKDGGYYEGQWKDNAMNGYGKLFYDNGSLAYEGQWYRDEFHGRGKVYNDSASDLLGEFNYRSFQDYYEQFWKVYDGDLAHDVKEGHGKLVLSNNQFYIGKFSNDLPDGEGYFHGKNKIVHGVWSQGKLVKEL